MCILLGAIFEISFESAMDTGKDLVQNNISLAIHNIQLGQFGEIKELQKLNNSCSWTTEDCDWINNLTRTAVTCLDQSGDVCMGGMGGYSRDYGLVIREKVLRDGESAIMRTSLTQRELIWGEYFNQGMGWHRSAESIGNKPSRGYLTNKKWILNEDITSFRPEIILFLFLLLHFLTLIFCLCKIIL